MIHCRLTRSHLPFRIFGNGNRDYPSFSIRDIIWTNISEVCMSLAESTVTILTNTFQISTFCAVTQGSIISRAKLGGQTLTQLNQIIQQSHCTARIEQGSTKSHGNVTARTLALALALELALALALVLKLELARARARALALALALARSSALTWARALSPALTLATTEITQNNAAEISLLLWSKPQWVHSKKGERAESYSRGADTGTGTKTAIRTSTGTDTGTGTCIGTDTGTVGGGPIVVVAMVEDAVSMLVVASSPLRLGRSLVRLLRWLPRILGRSRYHWRCCCLYLHLQTAQGSQQRQTAPRRQVACNNFILNSSYAHSRTTATNPEICQCVLLYPHSSPNIYLHYGTCPCSYQPRPLPCGSPDLAKLAR